MARVYVYERPVDSVLTNVTFYENLYRRTEEIQIKEEPHDIDENDQGNTFSPNTDVTSTTTGESTVLETRSADYINNKENELVLSKDYTDTENSIVQTPRRKRTRSEFENLKEQDTPNSFREFKRVRFTSPTVIHYIPERNSKSSINGKKCDICSLTFKKAIALKCHMDYYNGYSGYICDKCNAVFKSQVLLKKHKNRSACQKRNNKDNNDTRMFFCHFCERPFRRKPSLQAHIFHAHSKLMFSLEKEKNVVSSPQNTGSPAIKKMKQTSIVDFLRRVAEKEALTSRESVNLKEKHSKKVTPKQNGVLHSFLGPPQENRTTNNKTSSSNTDSSRGKRPFVEIHVDSDMVTFLLKNNVKTEMKELSSDSPLHNTSYNLRRIRRSSDHSLTDSNMSPASRTGRKIHSVATPKHGQRDWPLTDQQLNDKFKTKKCSVYLIRCDTDIKKNKELNGVERDSNKNTKRKRIEVPLVRMNNGVKVQQVDQLLPGSQKLNTIRNGKRTMFRCKVCNKSFSAKESLHEHLKLRHVFYISSICNARNRTMSKLLKHYLYRHTILRRMKCCVCFERFKSLVLLKRHMVVHCIRVIESEEDKPCTKEIFKCNLMKKTNRCEACGKLFWLESCLNEHEKVCQRMKVKIKKEHCIPSVETSPPPSNNQGSNAKFNRSLSGSESVCQSESVTHQKPLLKGVALVKGYNIDDSGSEKVKFPCTVCDAQFHTFQNLCLHERTYSQPAVYICQTCDTAFPTRRILKHHVSATHTPIKLLMYKYFCMFCTQGFSKKSRLQIHIGHFHANQTPIIPKPWLDSSPNCKVDAVCSICNLVFESNEGFIEHTLYYYKGQMFTCTFCDQTFHGMYMLNHHNKLKHYSEDKRKLYTLICNICNEGFNQESHLHAHKQHVHLNRVTYKPSCPQVNPSSNTQDHTYALINRDNASSSFPSKKFTCNICHLNFLREKDLYLHRMEYTNTGDFLCSYCPRRCPNDTILARHENLTHISRNSSETYTCRFCGEVVYTTVALKCHQYHFHEMNETDLKNENGIQLQNTVMLVTSRPDDGNFSCTICNMKFYSQDKLNYHLQEYANTGTYSCPTCSRKFPELYRLEVHKLEHSNLNYMLCKYRCSVCQEGFPSLLNVQAHALHFHGRKGTKKTASESTTASTTKRGPYTCDVCSMSFESTYSLKRHEARLSNTGDYMCDLCGRRFPGIEWLKEHQKRHAVNPKRQRYSCPDCDETFQSVLSQYQHIVHQHGKQKWFGKIPNQRRQGAAKTAQKAQNGKGKQGPTTGNTVNKESPATEKCANEDNASLIEEHLRNSGAELLSRMCPTCSTKYPTFNSSQFHFEGSPDRCIGCKLTFTTEAKLKQYPSKPHVRVKPINMEDAPCLTTKEDPDVVPVDLDKESETAEQLGRQSNTVKSAIHVSYKNFCPIVKYESDISSEKSNDEPPSDIGKLKVRDFATMI
ncbi:uncharacterized protein LOC116425063 [Nomia melanderi]|uniref:uncharacterized protein LOC116425063 n=1 Tax=Nomia melanderi TaxID=2448451 RepID=UPI003FCD85C8